MGLTDFHLYTTNNSCEKGHGIQYSAVGKPYTFAWCRPSENNRLPDDLKHKFMFSFKHGLMGIRIKNELLESEANLWDILRDKSKYDYKWVSRKEVATQKEIEALEIVSKEDIIKHKDLLFNNPISHRVICNVLRAYGVEPTISRNGEIGIAALQDYIIFEAIKQDLNNA